MSKDQTSRSTRTRSALRGSIEEIRERAGKARTWAAEQLDEHSIALGLSALAAGVAGAVLLPISRGERRALSSVAGLVKRLGPTTIETLPRIVFVARTINKVVELSRDSGRADRDAGRDR